MRTQQRHRLGLKKGARPCIAWVDIEGSFVFGEEPARIGAGGVVRRQSLSILTDEFNGVLKGVYMPWVTDQLNRTTDLVGLFTQNQPIQWTETPQWATAAGDGAWVTDTWDVETATTTTITTD